MLPPFSVPVYEPFPYALSGLAFLQLPARIQHYLVTAKLVPPHVRGLNSVEDELSRISIALFRSLKGTDIALVEKRHETVAMSREYEAGPSHSADRYAAADESRLREVLGNLLPEREGLFNDYMIKFDALIWLDQQRHKHYTPEDWQRHRDARLEPILDYTSRALVALDESVTKRTMTTGYTSRLPHSPSFHPPCTGTTRPRTNSHTSRAGPQGPDSDGEWPRGRRCSCI